MKEFNFTVEKSDKDGIKQLENKTIQLVPQNEFLSEWLRETNKGRKDFKEKPYPQFSSIFKVNEGKGSGGTLLSNAIGNMVTVAPENIERAVITFASRKSVKHSWINDMENFKKPSFLTQNLLTIN